MQMRSLMQILVLFLLCSGAIVEADDHPFYVWIRVVDDAVLVDGETFPMVCKYAVDSGADPSMELVCPGDISATGTGQNISVNLPVTRDIHNDYCYCYGTRHDFKYTYSIQLLVRAVPTIELGDDCPPMGDDGSPAYVESDTGKTCTCKIKDEFPSGSSSVYMYGTDGVSVYASNPGNYTTKLNYNQWNPRTTFICRGENKYTSNEKQLKSEPITYKILYITGPSNITIVPEGPRESKLCPGNEEVVELYCVVDKEDVVPKPSVTLRGVFSSDLDPSYINEDESDVIQYGFSFIPEAAGDYNVECRAENPQNTNISASESFNLTVLAPPTEPPRITVNGKVVSNGGRYTADLGDLLTVACTVEGGMPAPSTVTLQMGDETTTASDSTSVSDTLSVLKEYHGMTISCRAQHASGCYDDVTQITLIVIYGPISITTGIAGFESVMLCSGPTEVSVYCEIRKDNMYPGANVQLKGVFSYKLNPDSIENNDFSDVVRYNFPINVAGGGTVPLTCVASNSADTSITMEQEFNLNVYEPPPDPPKVTINGGSPLADGKSFYAKVEEHIVVLCQVEGGEPVENVNVTLKCIVGEFTTTLATSVSTNFTVYKDMDGTTCVCSALHASGCYDEVTEVTIRTLYGPKTSPTPGGPPGFERFDLCHRSDDNIIMYCDVNKDEVNPQPDVKLKDVKSYDLDPSSVELKQSGIIRYHFEFRPASGGILPARCEAVNPLDKNLRNESSFNFEVFEPPSPPIMTVVKGDFSSQITNGQKVEVSLGETVQVVCRVDAGFPSSLSLVLSCGEVTNTTSTTEASMEVLVEKNLNQVACNCKAIHVAVCDLPVIQFTFYVPLDTSITTFSVNGNSSTLQVQYNTENVEFECEAEGVPLPNITIKGLYSKGLLPDDRMSTLNTYTQTYRLTRPMACKDSDIYVCEANNGQSAVRLSVGVQVLCPVEEYIEPGAQPGQEKILPVSRSGRFQMVIKVYNQRMLRSSKLYRLLSGSGGNQRRRREQSAIPMPDNTYITRYEPVNANYGEITLDVFDMDMQDTTDYRLDVDNGHGSPLQLSFTTIVDETIDPYRSESDTQLVPLIAVTVTVCVLVLLAVAVAIVYFNLWKKTWRKKQARFKKRKDKERRASVIMIKSEAPPTPSSLRLWREKRF